MRECCTSVFARHMRRAQLRECANAQRGYKGARARRGRKAAMWLGALSVIAGLAILSVMLAAQRGENRPLSDRAAASGVESGVRGGSGGSGEPGAAPGSGRASDDGRARPLDEPGGRGSPRVSGEGEVRNRGKRPPAGGHGQVAVEPRSVFIESGGDASLKRELANTLTGKGVRTVAIAGRASVSVNARIQISIRPAPFGGSSALTADYVATLQMRDANGSQTSRTIDGHALDFGEVVVRRAAHRRAAEQLAEIINAAMRH